MRRYGNFFCAFKHLRCSAKAERLPTQAQQLAGFLLVRYHLLFTEAVFIQCIKAWCPSSWRTVKSSLLFVLWLVRQCTMIAWQHAMTLWTDMQSSLSPGAFVCQAMFLYLTSNCRASHILQQPAASQTSMLACLLQVAGLFRRHDDLLQEFTYFLPDSTAPAAQHVRLSSHVNQEHHFPTSDLLHFDKRGPNLKQSVVHCCVKQFLSCRQSGFHILCWPEETAGSVSKLMGALQHQRVEICSGDAAWCLVIACLLNLLFTHVYRSLSSLQHTIGDRSKGCHRSDLDHVAVALANGWLKQRLVMQCLLSFVQRQSVWPVWGTATQDISPGAAMSFRCTCTSHACRMQLGQELVQSIVEEVAALSQQSQI